MKLGIAKQQTLVGVHDPIILNGSEEWRRYIGDVRPYLRFIGTQQKSIAFIRIVPTGIICCYATRIGRGFNDCNATFLYIPSSAKIDTGQLAHLYESFLVICRGNELDTLKLRELADTEYESLDAVEYKPSERGATKMAVFKKSQGDLGRFLSLAGFQRFNSEYKGVIIVESDEPTVNTVDITMNPLDEPITILAPSPETIQAKWGDSMVELYVDGQPFKDSMTVLKGEQLKIEARHHGCNPVVFHTRATSDGETLSIAEASKFMADISPKDFTIINEAGKPISNAEISVNGWLLNNIQSIPALEKAILCVSAHGYETKTEDIDLLSTMKSPIRLEPAFLKREGFIELKDGKKAQITLKIRESLLPDSKTYEPELYGYRRGGNSRGVDYTHEKHTGGDNGGTGRLIRNFWIFGIALSSLGLVLGIGLTVLYMYLFGDANIGMDRQPTSAALEYVNGNKIFIRGQMEEIPELQGLFDAMNRFDSAAICRPEFEGLADARINPPGSQRLLSILEAIRRNPNPKPRMGAGYTEDNTIDVKMYIDYLNDLQNRQRPERQVDEEETQTEDNIEEQVPVNNRNSETQDSNSSEQKENAKMQYLKTQGTWNESNMSGYGLFATLYRPLNRGNINDFLKGINNIVPNPNQRSSELNELVDALQPHRNKQLNRRDNGYCTNGQLSLSSEEYLNWLLVPDEDSTPSGNDDI